MDITAILSLSLGVLIIGAFGFVLALFLDPFNKASVMRAVTKKNWVVVILRFAGGQLRFYAVKHDSPQISLLNRTFIPDERITNYVRSIPVLLFHVSDCKQVNISGVEDLTDKYRNPEHLNAVMLLLKSLYETLAMRKKDWVVYLLIAAVAVGFLGLAMNYLVWGELSQIRELAQSSGSVLSNLAAGS